MGSLQGMVKGKIEEANQILNSASNKVQQIGQNQGEDGKIRNDDDEDMDEGLDGGQDHYVASDN